MLETMIVCAIFGSIIGSCATTILTLLLIVTRPDTLRKALEELAEMKEYFRGREVKNVEKRLHREGRKHDKEVRKLIKQGRFER